MLASGYDVVVNSWLGVFLPAKTPAEVVNALSAAIRDATKSREMIENLTKVGNEPDFQTPSGFDGIVRADIARWGPIVKASGFIAED
jgi:tripartite-type tricarboxylate transporter receptor subunit TctC